MSSSRGAEGALLPRPVRPAGLWVVGQRWAAYYGDPYMDNLSINASQRQTKQQLLVDLLIRNSGATLAEMATATGWLPHTTRAALTGLRKKGYSLSSDKVDGVRTYRAVG